MPEALSDEELEKKLFLPGASEPSAKPLPDFDYIYQEKPIRISISHWTSCGRSTSSRTAIKRLPE